MKNDVNAQIRNCLEEVEIIKSGMSDPTNADNFLFLNKKLTDRNKILRAIVNDIQALCEQMEEKVKKNAVEINVVLSKGLKQKMSINDLREKITKYRNLVVKLKSDFCYLKNPDVFPESYSKSIEEIKRRNNFNKEIKSSLLKLQEEVETEKEARVQFSSSWGKYLTKEYVPILKFQDLRISIDFFNNNEDNELPKIFYEDSSYDSPGRRKKPVSRKNSEADDCRMADLIEENRKLKDQLRNVSIAFEDDDDKRKGGNSSRLKEVELEFNVKKKMFDELLEKYQRSEKRLVQRGHEVEQLADSVQKIQIELESQIKHLKDELKRKTSECKNLSKAAGISCFVCKAQAHSGLEYKNYSDYTKGFNAKLTLTNEKKEWLESRVLELTRSYVTVKRILFNHIGQLKENRNVSGKGKIAEDYKKRVQVLEEEFEKFDSEREKNKWKVKEAEKAKMSLQSEVQQLKEEIKSIYSPQIDNLNSLNEHNKKVKATLEQQITNLENELVEKDEKLAGPYLIRNESRN